MHAFNLAGYSMLFGYLSRQSTQQLEREIDNQHYNDQDLVEIKVPIQVPYLNSWGSYEPIEGEITINGNHHSYVKRKITRDTLFLMCLPNRKKDQLHLAKTDYGKSANDFDTDKKENNTAKKEVNFPQYSSGHSDVVLYPPALSAPVHAGFLQEKIPASFTGQIDLPPEFVA
ncbi:hypothetical protein [Flavihumibacter petaseus]|uniref:hypothetical protein n=1 Tax=Flavihumibacter petaseus TaxID=549295 RepID=UPI0012F99706|nr:hypothetical protein [Flavihumibacter petaseus]